MRHGAAPTGQNDRMSRQQRGGGAGEVARGAGYAAFLGAPAHRRRGRHRDRPPPDRRSQRQRSGERDEAEHDDPDHHDDDHAGHRPRTSKTSHTTTPKTPRDRARSAESDRAQRWRGERPGRRDGVGAPAAGLHVAGCRERLERAPPAREQRVLPHRPRTRGRPAHRARGRTIVPLHIPFPTPAPPFSAGDDCVVVVGSKT